MMVEMTRGCHKQLVCYTRQYRQHSAIAQFCVLHATSCLVARSCILDGFFEKYRIPRVVFRAIAGHVRLSQESRVQYVMRQSAPPPSDCSLRGYGETVLFRLLKKSETCTVFPQCSSGAYLVCGDAAPSQTQHRWVARTMVMLRRAFTYR
jgi:hypothetical protein